ncbi:MAG TPA: cupin domain-containing protein [Terracidiphilus sp.]|nr:cupin domain-containing protein [Terracidiphilus sp.]
MITRRDIFAGIIAMPSALEAFAAPAEQSKAPVQEPILGPAVFEWEDMKPVKNATGDVRSLCKSPTATLEQLEMHVSTLNAGLMSHPPHRHVNEELIILREGECETLSNGKWIRVTPGSVVFNASNSLHGFRNIGTTPAVYHVINWKPRGLEEQRA